MFIRKDLKEAIKNAFKIEKFSYIGIGKNAFDNSNLLIFDTSEGTIAMEIGPYKRYFIYRVKETPKFLGYYYANRSKMLSLYTGEEETYLKTNGVVTNFPGKAFDFTKELVLLALEEGN